MTTTTRNTLSTADARKLLAAAVESADACLVALRSGQPSGEWPTEDATRNWRAAVNDADNLLDNLQRLDAELERVTTPEHVAAWAGTDIVLDTGVRIRLSSVMGFQGARPRHQACAVCAGVSIDLPGVVEFVVLADGEVQDGDEQHLGFWNECTLKPVAAK